MHRISTFLLTIFNLRLIRSIRCHLFRFLVFRSRSILRNYETTIWFSRIGSDAWYAIYIQSIVAAFVFWFIRWGEVWAWLGSTRWNIDWADKYFLKRLISWICRSRNLRWNKSLPTWSSSSSWLRWLFTIITWDRLKLKWRGSTLSLFLCATLSSENLSRWQKVRPIFRFF